DPRVTVHIQDGLEFLKSSERQYDVLLLDLTDPETPAGPLYTREFFERCKAVLSPGGAVGLHLGAPFHEAEQVRHLSGEVSAVFKQVHGYGLHIPLYGAYWALAIASDALDPLSISARQVQQRLDERQVKNLQYYNAEVHGALF